MDSIFEIKKLKCGYNPDKTVLEVSDIQIPKGQLIFVVGVSGGGKSTLLETLGLMNNTIQEGSEFYFNDTKHGVIPMQDIWSKSDATLDEFRKKHFSFIFQKTNLMPNFSCGENMVLPAIFKGQSFEQAKSKVLDYMNLLDLREEIFEDDITEISGGQQQRLAFIRAMVADFSILFADEPTGNLDQRTARKLMTFLKDFLKRENKTGIVVSHDLKLAEDFADMIIPIETEGEGDSKKGFVKESSIFRKSLHNEWQIDNSPYNQIESTLKALLI